MYGVVYLIWNMVNGKKYVGQTVKTVKERFKQHAKKKSPIGNAIRKYGNRRLFSYPRTSCKIVSSEYRKAPYT